MIYVHHLSLLHAVLIRIEFTATSHQYFSFYAVDSNEKGLYILTFGVVAVCGVMRI
jgi:hypothetical protein